jgi:archaellum component FlaC
MASTNFRKSYEEAGRELEILLEEQERIEKRILALRKAMNVLANILHESGQEISGRALIELENRVQSSIAQDILKTVSYAEKPMTTSDVRDELNKLGDALEGQKNPLATINAVLNRLKEQGKIKETVKDGRKAWERAKSK